MRGKHKWWWWEVMIQSMCVCVCVRAQRTLLRRFDEHPPAGQEGDTASVGNGHGDDERARAGDDGERERAAHPPRAVTGLREQTLGVWLAIPVPVPLAAPQTAIRPLAPAERDRREKEGA